MSIIQGPDVKEDTCGEIIYSLSGSSSNGSFYTEGSYKAEVDLCGLTLTNPSGASIDIQNGKRIKLSVKEGTENFLTDGASGSQKGCLVCKGHLEIKGKGALTLAANKSHALYAKEYITIKNAAITVTSTVKDGINCNQYFNMESGSVTISGTGDDGIQVSFKDDLDREDEDTGSILISGGKINITTTATAAKAIKADGDIEVTGGEIIAKVEGGAEWDEEDDKTKASSCISADGNMTVSGGTFNLHATSSAGKGISVDGDLVISAGDITVQTEGGIFAYINGKEYDNYTGNTDNLDSDLKSSPKGIKADGNITINGGNISVTTKGNGGEGIESKKVMTINDGTINVYTYDDGLNSSSHMYINGGTITAVATNNDAPDSNGNLYMNGGYVIALGPGGNSGSVVITCPGLTSGSSYTMTSGSGSTTATATLTSGGGGRPW